MLDIAARDWERLIFRIYSAGLDNGKWAAFLEELNRIGGHAAIAMIGHDLAGGVNLGFITHNYDESFEESYQGYYAALNPWIPLLAKRPIGKTQVAASVLPHEELVKTEFYNDWILPQEDISAGVAITLQKTGNRYFHLSCNIRQRDIGQVQPRMLELMRRLAPHLSQAMAVTRRLAGIPVGQHYVAALDLVPSPVFLLDSRGRVRHANGPARRLVRECKVLLKRDGRISLEDSQADTHLAARLSAIASGHADSMAGSFPVSSVMAGKLYSATIAPFIHSADAAEGLMGLLVDDRPIAILCLDNEAEQATDTISAFARAFRLTAAELELARALYTGHSLQMVADARRISIHTARNQLKSIFSKTSVSRQHQLMALMVRHLNRFNSKD